MDLGPSLSHPSLCTSRGAVCPYPAVHFQGAPLIIIVPTRDC